VLVITREIPYDPDSLLGKCALKTPKQRELAEVSDVATILVLHGGNSNVEQG
jgi:hypothetical protein